MIKGAIFDLDGTLLNSMPVWENLGELYLRSLGIEAEKGLGEILFSMGMQQGVEYLITRYHLDMTQEEVRSGVVREIKDFYEEKVPLKEGAREFLEGMREKQIPMLIATSSDRECAEAALRRLHIRNWFAGILTCEEMGADKKRPDIYLAASLQLDTEPFETLVFEDSLPAIKTAKKAGFLTVAVYDKTNDRQLGKIWNTADIYLPGFGNFDAFWRKAAKLPWILP